MLPLRTPNHRRTARTPGRWIPGTVGTAAAAGVLTHGVLPRILGRWGAAGSEVSMPLPGHHLIPEPDSVQTMAVNIAAPPADQVVPAP